MLKAPIAIFLLLILSILIPACPGNDTAAQEPQYEKIIPPMEESSQIPSETTSLATVELGPIEQAVNDNPSNPDLRFSYMVELRTAGMIDQALEQAKILADMDAENPYMSIANMNIAEMLLDELPPDTPGRPELVRDAMDRLWVALGYEPESVPAHLMLGRLALEAGDNGKALHHLSIALTSTEIGPSLRLEMARIYIEQGDTDKAREHLEIARSLAEESSDTETLNQITNLLDTLE